MILAKEKFMLLKKKENQETGGDTDEAGAETEKPIIFYYVIALIVILLLNLLLFPRLLEPKVTEVDYGKFLQMVDNNEISEVQIQSNEIIFSDKSSPANYYKTGVMNDYKLVDRLYEAGITEFGTPIIEQMSPLMEFLFNMGNTDRCDGCARTVADETHDEQDDGRHGKCDELWKEQRQGLCTVRNRH